jgi:uncharacterized protein YbbC (DUF1343 family)
MSFGIDQLLKKSTAPDYGKCALVTNEAAVTSSGIKSRIAMLDAGIKLVKLFSPEHGLSIKGADGLRQEDSVDAFTGLPVVSLYGDKLAPDYSDLQGVDTVFFDIPDIGCRFYTYLWTMTHVMESCVKAGVKFIVLDRPNPTGLDFRLAEGPLLDERSCSSFIGRWNIPLRHCCTLGELARYFAATRMSGLNLEVIPVRDYNRADQFENRFSFVPTSPAIQNAEAAACYPGTGLLEGVNLNEGRGTDWSFRIVASPWLQTDEILAHLRDNPIAGVKFEACHFIAQADPYHEEYCKGILWKITDHRLFRPVHTSWQLLKMIHQMHPGKLEKRLYHTHANPSGENHLDKLTGVPESFSLLLSGHDPEFSIYEKWEEEMKPFLLYR